MATETVENYLKAIYTLCRESPTGETGVVRLAAVLGLTKGSATSMVKRLAESKLVKAERYGGVKLTAKGTRAALDILRRHRIVETFLVQTLKLDWSVVHAEAERLEHAISPVVLQALNRHLGEPAIDPHGDPIPGPDGRIADADGTPLSTRAKGAHVRVSRITDQSEAFLHFAAQHGLVPGVKVMVVSVDPAAQAMAVRPDGRGAVTLALAAAANVLTT